MQRFEIKLGRTNKCCEIKDVVLIHNFIECEKYISTIWLHINIQTSLTVIESLNKYLKTNSLNIFLQTLDQAGLKYKRFLKFTHNKTKHNNNQNRYISVGSTDICIYLR